MHLPTKILAAAAVSAFTLPALAQDYQTQQQDTRGYYGSGSAQSQQQQQPSVDVPKEKLENYVEARQKVDQISARWSKKMEELSREEQQAAVQNMNEQMVDVVRDKGLSVEEFNTIATAARQNPELQQRIMKMMR